MHAWQPGMFPVIHTIESCIVSSGGHVSIERLQLLRDFPSWRQKVRAFLITVAIVIFVGAVVLVSLSVCWQTNVSRSELGPRGAQQKRAQQRVVRKGVPPEQVSQAQIQRYQEQLDAEGFSTGDEKGILTRQTEAALRAYQQKYGFAITGELDNATQRSLIAGRTPTPGGRGATPA
jgi:hypothetical protein